MSVRVLFVCMGNICRSPTAHALFHEAVTAAGLDDEIAVDSAGTHAYHIGNPPDARATATALARDIDMTDLRARQVCEADFEQFDYVVAMDRDNLSLLEASCPPSRQDRLSLMLDWAVGWGDEVPDPYYGGDEGFIRVFDMLTEASQGLLAHIAASHGLVSRRSVTRSLDEHVAPRLLGPAHEMFTATRYPGIGHRGGRGRGRNRSTVFWCWWVLSPRMPSRRSPAWPSACCATGCSPTPKAK